MTVTGGSALPKDDIDRMMREAEQYADDDRRRREAAETRNHAEQLVHQTEKFLRENTERVPAESRPEVEAAIDDLKRLLRTPEDTAAVRAATEHLATVSQRMGQAMYAAAAASTAPADGPPPGPAEEDGVVDAEIVDDEKGPKGGAA
jgi:molecular chaperone DnaK